MRTILPRRQVLAALGFSALIASDPHAETGSSEDVVRLGGDPVANVRVLLAAIASAPAGSAVYLPSGDFPFFLSEHNPFIEINRPLRLCGSPKGTTLRLVGGSHYRELFRIAGDDIELSNFRVRREVNAPVVLINLFRGSRISLDHVRFDGSAKAGYGHYAHGLQLGLGNGRDCGLRIKACTFTGLSSSTLMTNDSRAELRDITIEEVRASNLDLNCPNATVGNVLIKNCAIDGSETRNFGIALAHVRGVNIESTTVTHAAWSGIHIEDYSADVHVTNSRVTDCAYSGDNANALVHIISGSTNIDLRDVELSYLQRRPAVGVRALSSQAGGSGRTPGNRLFTAPSRVTLTRSLINMSVGGEAAYFEAGMGHKLTTSRLTGSVNSYPGIGLKLAENSEVFMAGNTFSQWRQGIVAPWWFESEVATTRATNTFTQCWSDIAEQ